MDEDFKIIYEILNKIINTDNDFERNLIVFESFIKGLQIGLKNKYIDLTSLIRILKTNVKSRINL